MLLRSFLLENASWNCAFNMLALSVESSCSSPADLRGGILLPSDRLCLMYEQEASRTCTTSWGQSSSQDLMGGSGRSYERGVVLVDGRSPL